MSKRQSQSPQARWSRKKKKQGRCARCGEPRNRYAQLCDTHQAEFTAYMKAWRTRRKEQPNVNPPVVQTGA
jgi:hypothetical protein